MTQDRRTKKFYLALVRGRVQEDRVDIDVPIGSNFFFSIFLILSSF